jgi:hypothetical protein
MEAFPPVVLDDRIVKHAVPCYLGGEAQRFSHYVWDAYSTNPSESKGET